jgi:gliding motility-associated-like protein
MVVEQPIKLLFLVYQSFYPNADGINDFWKLKGASAQLIQNDYLYFDRYGKLLNQLNPPGPGWDGTIIVITFR